MLKMYYFLCLSYLLIITDVARCEPDYVVNFKAGGWLKLYSAPKPWEDAFLTCHNDGAVLASPLNKELAKALLSQLAQSGVNGRIFLGTHDLYSKGNYVSVEGVPLSDMDIRWGSGDNGADDRDCLTMSVDGSAYFASCKEPLPFICYKKSKNETLNECGTFDNEYHLNQQTGSCYKIHPERTTWTRAFSICASEGGYLVIPNDEEEARIIIEKFPASLHTGEPWDGIYVGLGTWGKERIWTTIHGERIEDVFNKWYTGEPNNVNGVQNRVQLFRSGRLDDVGETEASRMFACEKSKPKTEDWMNCTPV